MSNPNDVTRPRSPLTLSTKTPRPTTPRDEMAHRLYGGVSPSPSEHAAALAKALRAGSDPKPPANAAGLALAAALRSTTVTPTEQTTVDVGLGAASMSLFNENLSQYPATDDLGILTEPTARPGYRQLGLGGRSSPHHVQGFQRFKLARDRDRPVEFDGRVVAHVEELTVSGQVLTRAAIYETRGGKFIAEMTRREINPPVNYGLGKRPFLFAKATVFDNLDLAAMSFRTHGGRLTEALLKQIDVDSEFIE